MTQAIPRSVAGGAMLFRPYATLGAAPTDQQIAGTLISGGGGIAAAAAAGLSLTVPIIGAAIGLVTLGVEALLNSGCGQTCIVTSNWANQAEGLLKQNISEYFSVPGPRPVSAQAAALANFDKIWAYLFQQCSATQLGVAGQNCIGDRQSGACKWKAATPPNYPGQPAQGACWNWFNAYRDPIANDTNVVSDSTYTSNLSGGVSGVSSAPSTSTMFLIAGAALLAFGLMGGSN